MRSRVPSLEGTWWRSQDGKITMRPGTACSAAALPVTRLGLPLHGMIEIGRGSWKISSGAPSDTST